MSPVEQAARIVCFAGAIVFFWTGVVPLAIGTIEWVFNIGGTRTRNRR